MKLWSLAAGAAVVAAVGLALAGCSNGVTVIVPFHAASSSAPSHSTVPPTHVFTGAVDHYGVTWLCRPGEVPDPCASSLVTTVVGPPGSPVNVVRAAPAVGSRFDCFYVYPTVSNERTDNADLAIQPAETKVAIEQAARFSQVCNVYAPMYRQVTQPGLLRLGISGGSGVAVAYASLLSGFEDYVVHYNDGRPIVFLGHSQGAAMLIQLLQRVVEKNTRLLHLMVSAIILGGNVAVPIGRNVGGTFSSIPTCSSSSETGCVIAYSTFGTIPPPTSYFARPGQGVSLMSGQTASAGLQVACVNPAAISGGAGGLLPYFSGSAVRHRIGTPWAELPDLYTAACESFGGATWLEVRARRSLGDLRPVVHGTLGSKYGFHVYDVSLALGNLVADVAAEEAAFGRVG